MKIDIPYGDGEVTIDIEKERLNKILAPNEVEVKDEKENIKNALSDPIEMQRYSDISDFIKDGTLIIVNDATRATPTSKVLEVMREEIEKHDVRFIVARGSHDDPNEEEYREIFGNFYETHREQIYSHDAEEDPMVKNGETERGTPVKFNSLLSEAKNVFNINSVEPHYFAGYTGGRKSFLPGIASYETIENNHSHALEEGADALSLEGNPIHEDMIEAVEMIDKEIFSLNLTLDKDNRVYHASAGDWKRSFYREAEKAKEVFAVGLEKKSDVVVSAAHPMDVNLYQSAKAIENGKLALKENGILILAAKCPQGIGPKNFYELLSSIDSPEKTVEKVKEGYRLGYHKAGRIADLISCWDGIEKTQLWAVTDLDEETLNSVFITPKQKLQGAVEDALEKTGGDLTVLLNGCMVVPELED